MGLFEFILILMAIIVFGEIVTKVLPPLVNRMADLMGDMLQERRQLRGSESQPPPEAWLEELEGRLARVEERLEFLEELKAPDRPAALKSGRADRGPGRAHHETD
jgi:hypothetical protein